MFKKIAISTMIAAASITATAGFASAQTTTVKPANPLKCVGAADAKAAQASRVATINSEIAALNARLTAAKAANLTKAVARIQVRITEAQAHLANVQANQAKLAAKCA